MESKFYIWSLALYVADICTLRKVHQKYLVSFETWCWRSMEKTKWTDSVKMKEIFYRDKEERNILHSIKR
jgi:hypothetical protein